MNPVESVLLENIDKHNSCFIFPTETAASRWADHVLRLKSNQNASNCVVAISKFIAWDVFKQNSIKSKVQDKKSIPTALRKIFVNRLVNENAELCRQGKDPIFSSLIQEKWAEQAVQFIPWITEILPQLGTWFKKTVNLPVKEALSSGLKSSLDGDDSDMYVLARHYAQFLDDHGLFEPAWETPPFNDDGKECYIFFPQALSDYSEYKELLAASSHVKIINAENTEQLPCDTFFYNNSRREITEAALYIRALHENFSVSWDSIAVCISGSENYEPYVLREFTNRNIPYVKRTSKPLSEYPAGSMFRSILNCVTNDFSFSSLVSLILNRSLPWKETYHINNIITFGISNNCLYSWTEEKDGEKKNINVWEDAFLKPLGGADPETWKFFRRLKTRLQAICSSVSFRELRKQYFSFREVFLDMENCSEETDIILSRCISELMELVELEKTFPDVSAVDPFLFFTEYLEEVYYLAQQKAGGVVILPYKTAAAAPFDCHVILGAGQDSISVVYSHLDFLPRKKREELGIKDEDASAAFINMHKYNSVKNSAFFCSEQTFSGFTIPHPKTCSPAEPRERYAADPALEKKFCQDFYSSESSFISELSSGRKAAAETQPEASMKLLKASLQLHENQINGFTEWKKRRTYYTDSKENWKTGSHKLEVPLQVLEAPLQVLEAPLQVQKFINSIYAKTGKPSVSASSLEPYFQCTLKWLFGRVFGLENVQIETSLMAENISGLVYHSVLNYFLTELKNKNTVLAEPDSNEFGSCLPSAYQKLLEQSINSVFNNFPSIDKDEEKTQMSSLTARLLYAGKNDFKYHLENFLVSFLKFFAGCRVTGSEISYQLEYDSLILKGAVDCHLEDPEGKHIIIDFKLKYLPDRRDCTAEGDNGLSHFQIPMYITLTEENEKYKVYTALFYSILFKKNEVIIGTVKDSETEKIIPGKEEERIYRDSERYNLIFNEFKTKTEQFSKEISTGNFTVLESDSKNCRSCGYQRICRTVYIINRETIEKPEKN